MSIPCEGPVEAYRGLAFYRDCDSDQKLFAGRGQEKQQLLSLVLSSSLVVLFSPSGLGKTSLLNAGLLESLRERGFFPVLVRLTQDPLGGPVESVYACLRSAANLQGLTPSRFKGEGTLWEYFFESTFSVAAESKTRRVVLIFDQFEELFSIVSQNPEKGMEWKDAFLRELSDLVRGRVPEAVQARMEQLLETADDSHPQWDQAMALVYKGGAPDVKVVLSIGEESLGDLQSLKHSIPSIFDNALRLEALSPKQAEEAIVAPGQQAAVLGEDAFSVEPEAVQAMLDFCRQTRVGGRRIPGDTIDPMQLQILCQHADRNRRKRKGRTLTLKDLGGPRGIPRVFEHSYGKLLCSLPRLRALWSARGWYRPSLKNLILFHRPRAAGRALCERGLVTFTGDRNSLPASIIARKYGLSRKELDLLNRERLLDSGWRLGSEFYELSHDTLAAAVRRAKWRRRSRYAAGLAAAIVLPFGCAEGNKYLEARTLQATAQDSRLESDQRRDAIVKLTSLGYARGTRLRGTDLRDILFTEADFSNADLTGAKLNRTYCHHCRFVGAILDNSDLTGASLTEADLKKASLRGAKLDDSDLSSADLRGAKLLDAVVEKANFTDVRLDGADLTGTAWWLAYGWGDSQVDLLRRRWPATAIEHSQLFRREYDSLTINIDTAGAHWNQAFALNSRAWFLAIRGVRLDAALRDVRQALQYVPGDDSRFPRPHFLDTRGFILLQLGKTDSAVADLQAAVKAAVIPNTPYLELAQEASYRLGLAWCRLGDITNARQSFKVADSLTYRPTYELFLVPRKSECAPYGKPTPISAY